MHLIFVSWKRNCIERIPFSVGFRYYLYLVSVVFSLSSTLLFIRLESSSHLRIISTLFFVKYGNRLVIFQRLFLGVQKSCSIFFLPNPIVLIILNITHPQSTAERFAPKQYDCPVRLDNPFQFRPHRFERYYGIPLACSSSVWNVSNNSVNTPIWDILHLY